MRQLDWRRVSNCRVQSSSRFITGSSRSEIASFPNQNWPARSTTCSIAGSRLRDSWNAVQSRWTTTRPNAALKYPILGRKAWLFVGNATAGQAAAKLFTLTKSCNRLRADPFAYLQDVYARLPTTPPDELPSLLPDRWIKEHPQHLIEQRVYEAMDRAQRVREHVRERRRRAA